MEGSRGCIGNCTFCAMNYRDDIKDVNWTGRDIKDILNESTTASESIIEIEDYLNTPRNNNYENTWKGQNLLSELLLKLEKELI